MYLKKSRETPSGVTVECWKITNVGILLSSNKISLTVSGWTSEAARVAGKRPVPDAIKELLMDETTVTGEQIQIPSGTSHVGAVGLMADSLLAYLAETEEFSGGEILETL